MVLGSKYSSANALFCYLYKMLGVRAPWQLGDGYKNHIPIYSSSNYNSLKSQSPLDQVLGKWAEKWYLLDATLQFQLMFSEPQSNCIVIKLHVQLMVWFRAQVDPLVIFWNNYRVKCPCPCMPAVPFLAWAQSTLPQQDLRTPVFFERKYIYPPQFIRDIVSVDGSLVLGFIIYLYCPQLNFNH
jgi:hypothetical protein